VKWSLMRETAHAGPPLRPTSVKATNGSQAAFNTLLMAMLP
jgi:hypothetical protein